MPLGVNLIDSWGGSSFEDASEYPPARKRVMAITALERILIDSDF
tara:strand:- start:9830 stop:9964 length:135 start_codon:yes stop_codon:yes gene_type:complete